MNELVINDSDIQHKIYTIRGMQVMLDRDLAQLYGVETKRINEAVKNNPDKFPDDFMFGLSDGEFANLKSKISTSSWGGSRYAPKAFTEQGVYMLATIIKSKVATDTTIAIMRTFTSMKHFLSQNANLFAKIEQVEKGQITYEIQTNQKIDKIFQAIEDKSIKPKQGIFYNGQIFDAYLFVANLIKSAKNSIILIDNYIDESVLMLFSKNQNVDVTIYTKSISKQLKLDLKKYNAQYRPITIKPFKEAHDRFMILDENEVYHIGASLKDLGTKWFAFSRMERESLEMLGRLR